MSSPLDQSLELAAVRPRHPACSPRAPAHKNTVPMRAPSCLLCQDLPHCPCPALLPDLVLPTGKEGSRPPGVMNGTRKHCPKYSPGGAGEGRPGWQGHQGGTGISERSLQGKAPKGRQQVTGLLRGFSLLLGESWTVLVTP